MEWKKSSYDLSEFEKKQQLYIKEAMQMAKQSMRSLSEPLPSVKSETLKTTEVVSEYVNAIQKDSEKIEETEPTPDKEEPSVEEEFDEETEFTDSYEFTRFVVEEQTTEADEECAEENEETAQADECTNISDATEEEPCENSNDAISVEEQLRIFLQERKQENKKTEDVPDINSYVNNYNKSRCNCAACQKKRLQNQ